MFRSFSVRLLIGWVCLVGVTGTAVEGAIAEQLQHYQAQGVIFDTPPGFSEAKSLGGQTVGITLTAAANRTVSVRWAEVKPESLGLASLPPRELSEYVRFSFFGLTTTPKYSQTRRFLGQNTSGEVILQPQSGGTAYMEFYLVPLSLGRQVAIAFESDTEVPVYILEKTIQTIADSLRDDPPKKKR